MTRSHKNDAQPPPPLQDATTTATTTTAAAPSSSSSIAGPHPVLHWINELVHTEPWDGVVYGIFWTMVLVLVSPLVGILLCLWTMLQLVVYYCYSYSSYFYNNNKKQRRIEPGSSLVDVTKNKKHHAAAERHRDNDEHDVLSSLLLAVVITGCDTGFGCDLAHALLRKGFVVFAGCLRDESLTQYHDIPNAFAIKMDVTKNDEVLAAATQVTQWIGSSSSSFCSSNEIPNKNNGSSVAGTRYLHAVVNNAGMGTGGLVDWLDLSVFEQNMDVNYYGMIRTVKAFYPLFKAQAAQRTPYRHSRVVNMVSCAGLVTGGMAPAYHGAKFAAEAFSACLAHEMQLFGVQVVTVNPSFHSTPLTKSMRANMQARINNLPSETREEYGKDFFEQFIRMGVDLPKQTEWRSKVVIQELVSAVELVHPPPQMVVGIDGKFGYLLNRHFPVWLQRYLQNMVVQHAIPKMLHPKDS